MARAFPPTLVASCAALVVSAAAVGCDPTPAQPAPEPSASASAPSPAVRFAPAKVEWTAKAMGTRVVYVAYTTPSVDEAAVRAAMTHAHDELVAIEKLMSSWRDDSELAEINRRAGAFVPVSSDTYRVLEKSLWAGRISEGTFDITFNTMGDLWKFGDAREASPKPPARDAVEKLRKLVDYRLIELDAKKRAVKIPKGRKIGLGGIAKGYAIDRVAAVLRARGVRSFLAQAGGDLFGAGRKPDGSPWSSGIRDPRGEGDSFFATLPLEDHAFSTAGDYARSYVHGGRRYHHIIDPRTGYPATACRSVTVWAPDALTADAVDDAVFILGPEKGLALVENLQGVGAVIVDSDNRVHVSKRLQGKVRVLREPTDGI